MTVWKPITDFPNYEVSDDGRVRSFATSRRWPGRLGHELKQFMKGPYLAVNLVGFDGRRSVHVHRLVAAAFVSNPSQNPYVNHIDGVKTRNLAVNLEWVTPAGNIRHAIEVLGRKFEGEAHPRAKLTELIVREIRASALPLRARARLYGVSQKTVQQIVRRETWHHI